MISLGEKFGATMEKKGTPLENLSAPARIVMKVFEEGSWAEDIDSQSMWAGLLASSCTRDGKDDSNLIFVNILGQMTAPEARLFDFIFQATVKSLLEDRSTEMLVCRLTPYVEELRKAAKLPDVSLLRRVLERLKALGLLDYRYIGGANPPGDRYGLDALESGLHLYARCQGCSGSPADFLAFRRQCLT